MGELRDLLEEAAPRPTRPLDTAALLRRARRSQRVGVGLAALVGLGVAVVAVAAVLGVLDRPAVVLDAATPEPDPEEAVAPPAPAEPYEGPVRFEVLGVSTSFDAELGIAWAPDSPALAALWRDYAFPGAAPAVDLDQHVVVVLARTDDACPDEVTGFDHDGQRLAVRWQPPPGGCNQPAIPTATAVAIDRATVPAAFTVVSQTFGEDHELRVEPGPPPPTPAPAEPVPAPPAAQAVLGEAPLPADGAAVARLADGTPVWVVRHDDGAVSVLAADAPMDDGTWEWGLPGLRAQALWMPAERRFMGPTPYDERGRSFHGRAARNLDWHAVTVEGDRVVIGERLGPVPGGGAIATPRDDDGPWVEPVFPDDPRATTVIPLADALAGPDQVVVVDASLVAWTDGSLRLCAAPGAPELWGWDGCPPDAPTPVGVGPADLAPGYMNVWFGPLRVRIDDGRVVEVVALGGGTAGGPVESSG